MRTPPLLLGAALLFWGVMTGMPIQAGAMALLLEMRPLIPWRWQPELKDFQRVADLGALILGGIFVLGVMGEESPLVMVLLRQLPMVFFPVLLGVVFSDRNGVPAAALFHSLRGSHVPKERRERAMPLHYPFLGLCLLAAGAGQRFPHYDILLILFLLPALWPLRRPQVGVGRWLMMIAVAGGMGIALHNGLGVLQEKLGDWVADYWSSRILGDPDPFHRQTALGRLGSLKGGHGILFQVREEGAGSVSLLLREASYNLYAGNSWNTVEAPLSDLQPVPGEPIWLLGPEPAGKPRVVEVHRSFFRQRGLLQLPLGGWRVERLPTADLRGNRLGAYQVEGVAETVIYRALYDPRQPLDGPPDRMDVQVPERERSGLEQAWERMGGSQGLAPGQVVERVKEFLAQGFSYTLRLSGDPPAGRTSLSAFLLDQKSGHCEYFAAATVMLLRQAGVPARYAAGFSVQDPPDEDGWRPVRQRHAHAWAQVWLGGRWQELDTTPGGWPELEGESAPVWQSLLDGWNDLRFRLVRWRLLGGSGEGMPVWLYGVLVVLVGVLVWRLGRQGERLPRSEVLASSSPVPGEDSPFRAVEAHLAGKGWRRLPGQGVWEWVEGMGDDSLRPLVVWHYRLRFDPRGLSEVERGEFRQAVSDWLGGRKDPD